jgi:Raf kinase inhibitor-like YbhB/YbcL family protein
MQTFFPLYKRNIYRMFVLLSALLLIILLITSCSPAETPPAGLTLSLSSTAFHDGSAIPDKYTGQGEDISPPLSWDEPPAGTKSLALIMDDLDTSGDKFTHWVLINVPADVRNLPEAATTRLELLEGAVEGKNDFGETGYGGPRPPLGKVHRYRFSVYALDIVLDLEVGVSKARILNAIKGHILAQGELIGIYQR